MALYILYRIGFFLVNSLPLKFAYGLACFVADTCYLVQHKDRESVIKNIGTILGGTTDRRTLRRMARELYRNFAKYLVDFFRSSNIDTEYVKKFVNVEGAGNIDAALDRGKGVVALSAHIGNWELGGSIISLIGYPLSAVVLPHSNKKIDNFFKKQRLVGKVAPIDIGIALKECYRLLKANKVLGLLGDRDFTKSGLMLDFFGKKTLFPKGPAVFSYRLGSAIVPTLVVREPDDTFRITFEEPIYADQDMAEDAAILELTKKCAQVMESYVRRYPTQWYIFRDMWSKDE